MEWFYETLHDDVRAAFKVARLLYREKTSLQDLVIFENASLGRVLGLDGVVQTTEADEYIYHEMMIHPALFAHGRARRVLIIGGGDGGCAREALRHPEALVTMVEIDQRVVELCRRFLPKHNQGAFDDPRFTLVVEDGARYVRRSGERYDVIVVDSTDPLGPGKVLFSRSFYQDCRQRLNPGGVLITQNGVPFLQSSEVVANHKIFGELFADHAFFTATVPFYVGGTMAFGWASDDAALRRTPRSALERRMGDHFKARYYNPRIHEAAFALPNDVLALLAPGAQSSP